ncbi:MAG: hypothetical protein DCC67_02355 [Planctomycetota bacterium]|nr:MAG: hypothetical protein DCC67_02355 [Planctomycetota bacterium]
MLAIALSMDGAARDAAALELVMTFDESVRYVDAYGVDRTHELPPIVEAAKSIWEDIIEDEQTLNISYGWRDLPSGIYGAFAGAITFDTHVAAGRPRSWFIDPTPFDHSEFDFSTGQRLLNDAGFDPTWVAGYAPETLEIGYVGRPTAADQPVDLLTVALHEIGHWLGVNRFSAYDINPQFVGGRLMTLSGDGGHLPIDAALMSAAVGSYRKLPSAADVFAAASNSLWTRIDLPRKEFLGRNGAASMWTDATEWAGGQVPGRRDSAYLRHGGQVRLAPQFTEWQQVADLIVRDGTELLIESNGQLKVLSDPSATNSHGSVDINQGAKLRLRGDRDQRPVLQAESLQISGGSQLELEGGVFAIGRRLAIDASFAARHSVQATSVISGYGTARVGSEFVSGGLIEARSSAAPQLLEFLADASLTEWRFLTHVVDGSQAGQVVASQGDVRFTGGLTASSAGRLLAEHGRSISFATAELHNDGEVIIRDAGSFIFASHIANTGAIRLRNEGRVLTGRFHNSGVLEGSGQVLFSESFANEGVVRAVPAATLTLAAAGRRALWDLDGGNRLSMWTAATGGRLRLVAPAAVDVQFAPLQGSIRIADRAAVELLMPLQFDLQLASSGHIAIQGPAASLAAPLATLRLGTDAAPSDAEPAQLVVDRGLCEVESIIVGSHLEQGGAGVLQLDGGVVAALGRLEIRSTGAVRGAGEVRADVINAGMIELAPAGGPLRIGGSYEQRDDGVLAVRFARGASRPPLEIVGAARLGGELHVTFDSWPVVGQSYRLLDFASLQGGFRRIVIQEKVGVQFLPAAGVLVITAVAPEPNGAASAAVGFAALVVRRRRPRTVATLRKQAQTHPRDEVERIALRVAGEGSTTRPACVKYAGI